MFIISVFYLFNLSYIYYYNTLYIYANNNEFIIISISLTEIKIFFIFYNQKRKQ